METEHIKLMVDMYFLLNRAIKNANKLFESSRNRVRNIQSDSNDYVWYIGDSSYREVNMPFVKGRIEV